MNYYCVQNTDLLKKMIIIILIQYRIILTHYQIVNFTLISVIKLGALF